ncbi:HAD family hydrolase [Salinifilum aidingensis]
MTMRAVLFDFSGTLFRLEEDESWSADFTDDSGRPLDTSEQAEIMRRLTAPAGQVVQLGQEFEDAWENRDLDPVLHRKVYMAVLQHSGLDEEQAASLYSRLIDPDQWTPYPDAVEVLRRCREAGLRVAVVSNIAFDFRAAFERTGAAEYVDEFLLSYEEGLVKPDAKLFLRACERLGVDPVEAVMVGDSAEADGGATALGCRFELVESAPTSERPDALRTALADVLA